MPSSINRFIGEYRWLSNFWGEYIRYNGLTFPTLENAYQAQKTLDPDMRALYTSCPPGGGIAMSPGQARRRGRSIYPLRPDWDEVKDRVMLDLVRIKFSVPSLGARLLNTGDAELVEGNDWGDTYWGVCGGIGENRLGKILMRVRQEIRDFERRRNDPVPGGS